MSDCGFLQVAHATCKANEAVLNCTHHKAANQTSGLGPQLSLYTATCGYYKT